jgi:hypothetical protein
MCVRACADTGGRAAGPNLARLGHAVFVDDQQVSVRLRIGQRLLVQPRALQPASCATIDLACHSAPTSGWAARHAFCDALVFCEHATAAQYTFSPHPPVLGRTV